MVYLQPLWCNSLLKCVSQPEIAKNSLKSSISGVKGHSRSSMLTFLRSSLPVLVMISSMSVPICNHFHVRRANNGEITLFKRGTPLSPPHSWGHLSPSGMKFCRKILEALWYKPEVSISPGLRSVPGCGKHQDTKTDTKTELP